MKSKSILAAVLISVLISCEYSKEDDGYGFEDVDFSGLGDKYADFEENQFINVGEQPISTFSIDADGASYSNMRRFILAENSIPPKNAIRTEELINYFDMGYEYTPSEHPISLNGEVSTCPWHESNKLIRIGIKAKPIPKEQLPASNFVFLIDVSGSMANSDKLELLKNGFNLFVDELSAQDRVSIVTYAGSDAISLSSVSGSEKKKIKAAINGLGAGGGTAGAQGIVTAYKLAQDNFINGGNNRVILGSDGDFNIGVSNADSLVALIERKRESGIFLTVLGVGRGNLNEAMMEQVANKGNGNYEYIDNIKQLQKVFIYDFGKFYTVAKDVKVQVEFNPQNVISYRLIGYENRLLETEDFEDDDKDAGEIGSGQTITALYEIVPNDNALYKTVPTFKIDFRYKMPDSEVSQPMGLDIFDSGNNFIQSSEAMKFSGSIASFSMLLRNSAFKGTSTYNNVLNWMPSQFNDDTNGFKEEFKSVVEKANVL